VLIITTHHLVFVIDSIDILREGDPACRGNHQRKAIIIIITMAVLFLLNPLSIKRE